MIPENISPLTINILLQYILPPSQFSQPLPKHLTSISLLKRHHYLHISPDDPLEYLCWPSPSRERTIELLETLSTHRTDEGQEAYNVRYTSDIEYTYAHVQLDSLEDGLRIVFQWDGEDGWKYHDTNIMPFPPGSHESLQDVIADAVVKLSEGNDLSVPSSSTESAFGGVDADENDDDAYWNAYGTGEDVDLLQQDAQAKRDAAADNGGEDAYWAQYASVQGSGDSTVPSPVPNERRKTHPPHLRDEPPTPPTPDIDQNQCPLPIPIPRSKIHDQQMNLEPPSPSNLARRLRSISPREGSQSRSRTSSRGPGTPSEPSFSTVEEKDEDEYEDGTRTVQVISPILHPVAESNGILSHSVEGDAALKESIRSVWRLWKMSRRVEGGSDDKELFLRVAREVVESS